MLGVGAHGLGELILTCGHPHLLSCLAILLGQHLEVSTALEGSKNGIRTLLGIIKRCARSLYQAILYGIWQLNLSHQLHDVKGVVQFVFLYGRRLSHGNRIKIRGDIHGICFLAKRDTKVRNGRGCLAHYFLGIGSGGQLGMIAHEVFLDGLTVFRASGYLHCHILDIATLNRLNETSLHLFIFRFQLAFLHFHLTILHISVRKGCQLYLALLILFIESHLGLNGVREETICQQSLILLRQGLLTERLLYESPIAIDDGILLHQLCIGLRISLLRLVIRQELLQRSKIKATCLLINERRLQKHGVGTFLENVLQLSIGNRQA